MKSIISLYVEDELISPTEPDMVSSLLLRESSNVFVLSRVVLIFTDISLTPRSICEIPLILSPALLILAARLLTAFLMEALRRLTLVLITVCIIVWLFWSSVRHCSTTDLIN